MRKTISVILLYAILIAVLCSCSLLDNGIQEFGDAAFAVKYRYPIQDVSAFLIEGKTCYDVGAAEENLSKGECIAALNGKDHYSFRIYRPADQIQGVWIVNAISLINLVNCDRIYAAEDAESVPAEMLYDFPHTDEWWNGGQITEINGVKVCRYRSTLPGRITPGEKRLDFGGKEYFAFPDQPLWLLTVNEKDPERYDLYYDAEKVTELPGEVIRATVEIPGEQTKR